MKINNDEFLEKLIRLREFMKREGLAACILRRTASLAWITAGARTYVNTANGEGPVTAVITADRQVILTSEIEAPRLRDEEGLASTGWEIIADAWYGPAQNPLDLLRDPGFDTDASSDNRTGCDTPVPIPAGSIVDIAGPLARLRSQLLPVEQRRAEVLGADCAAAMQDACDAVEPGQSEYEIAALLWKHTQRRGIQAIVNLVAFDGRIHRYRHPLPTSAVLHRHAMLVLCGRRDGMITSMTRILHFGPLPEEIRRRQNAAAAVDAAMINASRPGTTTGEILNRAIAAYTTAGFPEAWREHHQGGITGYEPREFLALPGGEDRLASGMLCAWNPSLPGAKSEDTVLVGEDRPQVLTSTPGWPMIQATDERTGVAIERPDILIR
ncbi:MAG: M24 family metallopeptidase [Spirochaetaceae bacterium]|nr:MAG: M24 family metallopeptidase [Spirochaetaceae bacterium]